MANAALTTSTTGHPIRDLNDAFRRSFANGHVVLTGGVAVLDHGDRAIIIAAVRGFDAFGADNDPYDEHDFGTVEHGGERYFWKIDYYDADLRYGSEDPADPAVTQRVLTIMRTDEY